LITIPLFPPVLADGTVKLNDLEARLKALEEELHGDDDDEEEEEQRRDKAIGNDNGKIVCHTEITGESSYLTLLVATISSQRVTVVAAVRDLPTPCPPFI